MLPIVREHLLQQQREEQNLINIRRRMEIREKSNPFELPDNRFIELFRLNKEDLIEEIRPLVQERFSRKGITLEAKFFAALRFYATGSYQRCIGQEFTAGMSQTSIHRSILSITRALEELSPRYVKLPNTREERNTIKVEFMTRYNFPGVIGVIAHVALLKPSEEEHNFINRKGFHSINCQVICDHNLKITGLNANFGGSTHDSFIWRNSAAHNFMANLHHNNELCWLLGDSGYPLQPYLLTPFHNPPDRKAENYNQALCIARSTIERCFSLLKGRFRCLLRERVARYTPLTVSSLVKACAVLHNICIDAGTPYQYVYEEREEQPADPPH